MALTLADSLTRLRTYLRDPEGLVWSDAQLLAYWNRALIDLAQKTGIIERAEFHPYPSRFTVSITFDWERAFVEGDVYQWATDWQHEDGFALSHGWEAAWYQDSPSPPHAGYRITHPWEVAHGDPGEVFPCKLNARSTRIMYLAFDRRGIGNISLQELGRQDRFYKTRTGRVINWYWWDEVDNLIALYPRPATIVIDDLTDADVYSDTAGLVDWDEGSTETQPEGMVTAEALGANNIFVYYQAYEQVTSAADEVDYPEWTRHYIECATLEMAYSADTDGFVPSLRDYWKARKENGYEYLKRLRTTRMVDRRVVRGPGTRKAAWRHPTLPSNYNEGPL